jgi:DHA2 family multidrug resistance protein-like MFS transporter
MTAVLMAICLAVLDISLLNTALPSLAKSLYVTDAEAIWLINSYQIVMLATLLLFASLSDIVGHKFVYVMGLSVFTAASVVCALSSSLLELSIARGLQGLGASALTSINLALIRDLYPPHRFGRGVGISALVVALTMSSGPLVAAGLLAVGPWPLLFAINIPLGIIALALGVWAIPRSCPNGQPVSIEASVLLAATVGSLAVLLANLGQSGLQSRICYQVVVSGLFLTLLARHLRRYGSGYLPLELFRIPSFRWFSLISALAYASQGMAFVVLPFLLYATLDRPMLELGWLMAAWPLLVAVVVPSAGRLSDRISPRWLISLGLALMGFGLGLLAQLPAQVSSVDIVWRIAVCGAGFGIFQAPNICYMMTFAPAHLMGSASGMIATTRLSGQLVGAALAAFCFQFWEAQGPGIALGLAGGLAGLACLLCLAERHG